MTTSCIGLSNPLPLQSRGGSLEILKKFIIENNSTNDLRNRLVLFYFDIS